MRALSLVLAFQAVRSVYGWGAAGHEMVASIAEVHLYPETIDTICEKLLPSYADCHLAPIAAWADKVRRAPGWGWSGQLHFVNGIDDHPPETCFFGEHGWVGKEGHNILSAIRNTTDWLAMSREGGWEAFNFLVHFLGDLHMPLHLVGRDKGGNGVRVRFDGRLTSLHSLWDGYLIAKNLRTLPYNYTLPLPSTRIERVLTGAIYDPYIRQILWETTFDTWAHDMKNWTNCPEPALRRGHPHSVQVVLDTFNLPPTDDQFVCPSAWARPIHQLACDLIWPSELNFTATGGLRIPDDDPYLELDTPEYYGEIKKRRVMEKLLATAGVRLAGILNWLYGPEPGVMSLDFTYVEQLKRGI